MSTQLVSRFLDKLKARIDAVTGVGRCLILAGTTLEKLLHDPVWPTVMLNDAGGEIDPNNGVLWCMNADITIIDTVDADTFGEQNFRDMQTLGDAVIAAVLYDESEALYLAAQNSMDSEQDERGQVYVMKSYRLEYMLDTRQEFLDEVE